MPSNTVHISLEVGSDKWRDWMMHAFAKTGFKASWLEYYGKHFEFEEADKRADFDTMFAMLSESEDMRDYLCYHMKMTRGVLGPYKIESHAAFELAT